MSRAHDIEPVSSEEQLAVGIGKAAKIVDLSENTVRGLIYRGELHSIHVGRKHLVPLWSIRRFLGEGNGETSDA
jgi:hypothetical protein